MDEKEKQRMDYCLNDVFESLNKAVTEKDLIEIRNRVIEYSENCPIVIYTIKNRRLNRLP